MKATGQNRIPYVRGGKVVTREEFDRTTREWPHVPVTEPNKDVPMVPRTYTDAEPLVSESLGVLPHQVAEARETYRAEGLSGVRVRDDGAVEFTARGKTGRVGLMKLRGKFDRDGGYGDG